MKVYFQLNGKNVKTGIAPGQTLLEFLRATGIYSVKHGCDQGECGACTVLVEGKAQNACLILMHSIEGKTILTLEGLNPSKGLNPLQAGFLKEGAFQCGYCTPGMILSIKALLTENEHPGEGDIRDAMTGNLCRCTGYVKPVKAILNLTGRGKNSIKIRNQRSEI